VNMLNYSANTRFCQCQRTGLIVDAGAIKTYYDGLGLAAYAMAAELGTLPRPDALYAVNYDGHPTSIATSLARPPMSQN